MIVTSQTPIHVERLINGSSTSSYTKDLCNPLTQIQLITLILYGSVQQPNQDLHVTLV